MTELSIVRLARLSLAFAPKPWAFAHERRAEIDAYFAGLREKKPQLYNGRVLLLRDATLSDDAARRTALTIWAEVNEPNLIANIRPTRGRASLILEKGPDHAVRRVLLRKL